MPKIKKINKNKNVLIRPFLTIKKKKIKKFAKIKKIQWIEDKSNKDTYFERNYIRKKIIPILQKKWKYFEQNCSKSAKICSSQEIVLRFLLKNFLKKKIIYKSSLNIKECEKIKIKNKEKKYLYKTIIKYWINLQNKKKTSFNQINSIFFLMIKKRQNSIKKIEYKKFTIYKYKNFLHYIIKKKKICNQIIFWRNIKKKIILPGKIGKLSGNFSGKKLILPKKSELINIRFNIKGKIKITNKKTVKIKKIWQKFKIAPWKRKRIPFLFYDNKFISAIGLFVAFQGKPKKKKQWTIIWKK